MRERYRPCRVGENDLLFKNARFAQARAWGDDQGGASLAMSRQAPLTKKLNENPIPEELWEKNGNPKIAFTEEIQKDVSRLFTETSKT